VGVSLDCTCGRTLSPNGRARLDFHPSTRAGGAWGHLQRDSGVREGPRWRALAGGCRRVRGRKRPEMRVDARWGAGGAGGLLRGRGEARAEEREEEGERVRGDGEHEREAPQDVQGPAEPPAHRAVRSEVALGEARGAACAAAQRGW